MMIVLAVAGTLLATTFMAFPAIQRNGSNGQRRNDVQAMLQAISQYGLNNSGNFPVQSEVPTLLKYSKLTLYLVSDITLVSGTSNIARTPQGPINDSSKVYIYNYQKCDTSNQGISTAVGADYKNIVALYAVAGRGTATTPQCSEL